jgi:hypothetical protein
MWTAAGMREANKRGAGGGAVVAARIRLDPDLVLAGKHGANIEFLKELTYNDFYYSKFKIFFIDVIST